MKTLLKAYNRIASFQGSVDSPPGWFLFFLMATAGFLLGGAVLTVSDVWINWMLWGESSHRFVGPTLQRVVIGTIWFLLWVPFTLMGVASLLIGPIGEE